MLLRACFGSRVRPISRVARFSLTAHAAVLRPGEVWPKLLVLGLASIVFLCLTPAAIAQEGSATGRERVPVRAVPPLSQGTGPGLVPESHESTGIPHRLTREGAAAKELANMGLGQPTTKPIVR